MTHIICNKFHENILISISYSMIVVYICIKFHENVLDSIKVIEQKRFSSEKFQKGIVP